MGGLFDILSIVQLLISTVVSIPIFYWVKMSLSGSKKVIVKKSEHHSTDEEPCKKICVILPMRNERINVERKLQSIITEILPYQGTELLVADSDSRDETGELAINFLKESELEFSRWSVEKFDVPGKNYALNRLINIVNADIIVISDADAKVSPGWMEVILNRMSEQEVGVVSGIEKEQSIGGGFNRYYRSKSNKLRIWESIRDSTPVLEGSILAWKTGVLRDFKLNEDLMLTMLRLVWNR